MALDWKSYVVPITVENSGPRSFKSYTRNGKTFWRNYRRDVTGGVTFLERYAVVLAAREQRHIALLGRQLFG